MNDDSQIALMRRFVHQKLVPWPEFEAALIVGSVAHGESRVDSDVDCILVFGEVNEAIVPAEFVWAPETDSFHTIFEVEATDVGGIQIDATRVALEDFRNQEWPESFKHELAHGLMLFDRNQSVTAIVEERVTYPPSLRTSCILEHAGWAAYFVEEWRLLGWMDRGGVEGAHDQLTAAFEALIKLLHAYNGEWLPWRYRWLVSTQKLNWLPEDFQSRARDIIGRVDASQDNVLWRRTQILSLLDETRERLEADGLLADPGEAFIATHPGLGYAHNFDAWRRAHQDLMQSRTVN